MRGSETPERWGFLNLLLLSAGVSQASSAPSGQARALRGSPWPSLHSWGAALKARYGAGNALPEVQSQPGNGVCGRVLLGVGWPWEMGPGPWVQPNRPPSSPAELERVGWVRGIGGKDRAGKQAAEQGPLSESPSAGRAGDAPEGGLRGHSALTCPPTRALWAAKATGGPWALR